MIQTAGKENLPLMQRIRMYVTKRALGALTVYLLLTAAIEAAECQGTGIVAGDVCYSSKTTEYKLYRQSWTQAQLFVGLYSNGLDQTKANRACTKGIQDTLSENDFWHKVVVATGASTTRQIRALSQDFYDIFEEKCLNASNEEITADQIERWLSGMGVPAPAVGDHIGHQLAMLFQRQGQPRLKWSSQHCCL